MILQKGYICYVNFGNTIGSEQGGIRPAYIGQNDMGNKYSPCTIVLPMTSKIKKPLKTHVEIKSGHSGLKTNSYVLAEQIRTIDKSRILGVIGKANEGEMKQIDKAMSISLALS